MLSANRGEPRATHNKVQRDDKQTQSQRQHFNTASTALFDPQINKKKVITRRSSPKVAIALAGLFDTIMIHELKQELKDNYYFH